MKLLTISFFSIFIWFIFPVELAQGETEQQIYRDAIKFRSNGEIERASQTFEKLFGVASPDLLLDEYGPDSAGLFFDYSLTLIPQRRWEHARGWLIRYLESSKGVAEKNNKTHLAKFQLGYVEARMGNHEKALQLYDEFKSGCSRADTARYQKSFKLRYGASLLQTGQFEEGYATLYELLSNRESWRVSEKYLSQAILETGYGWIKEKQLAGNDPVASQQIVQKAHAFLSENLPHVTLSSYDSLLKGVRERILALGKATAAGGLPSVSLRCFSHCCTLEDVNQEINLREAQNSRWERKDFVVHYRVRQRLVEAQEAVVHPDAEILRFVAACWEQLGNTLVPQVIYTQLVAEFLKVPVSVRAEFLFEAMRYAAVNGDLSSTQYFCEKFRAEIPPDHSLTGVVSTTLLESLFATSQFLRVIDLCKEIKSGYEPGSLNREKADALLPITYYSMKDYDRAAELFESYLLKYPDAVSRETVLYHRASNSLMRRKFRDAVNFYSQFLKEFPKSGKFIDKVLADVCVASYNLEQYGNVIAAATELRNDSPESPQVAVTMNLKADAYLMLAESFQVDGNQKRETESRLLAAANYRFAREAAEIAVLKYPDNKNGFIEIAAEAVCKQCECFTYLGKRDQSVQIYDDFMASYRGTSWEPRISLSALEALEAEGRGTDGLVQIEKMIRRLGYLPLEKQDGVMLRKMLAAYTALSVRLRQIGETVERLDEFPGLDSGHRSLRIWLKVQKALILQDELSRIVPDSSEYAARQTEINQVYEELTEYDRLNFPALALYQTGMNFSRGSNLFRAVPYFEELLKRNAADAEPYHARAELELGKLDMRSPRKFSHAKRRFLLIIEKYRDQSAIPEAHLNLAKLEMKTKSWEKARDHLKVIARNKHMFEKDRQKRAEALFLLGQTEESLHHYRQAADAYLAVLSACHSAHEFTIEAFSRFAGIIRDELRNFSTETESELVLKRSRQLALYRIYLRHLWQWRNLDSKDDSPTGALALLRRNLGDYRTELQIEGKDALAIRRELGIPEQWNPEAG